MKRVLSVLLVVVMMLAVVGCGGQKPQESTKPAETSSGTQATQAAQETKADPYADLDPVTIRVLNTSLLDTPSGKMVEGITKEIEEKSGGKIKFNVTYGATASFGGEPELYDMCRSGSTDMTNVQFAQLNAIAPEVDVFNWPYVFESSEHVMNFFNNSETAKPLIEKMESGSGLKLLTACYGGCRNLTTKGIEVRKPEDLKGVKIRSMDSAIFVAGLNAMGATAVPVAWAELYFALQTGVVNGQENSGAVIQEGKIFEVQDTLIMTEHLYSVSGYWVNGNFWNKLPEAYQTLIQDTYKTHAAQYAKDVVAVDQAYNEEFVKAGMKLIADVDKAAFVEATKAVFMERYADKKEFIDLYNAVKAALK